MGRLSCAQNNTPLPPFWTKPVPGSPEARTWPGYHTYKEVEATHFGSRTSAQAFMTLGVSAPC